MTFDFTFVAIAMLLSSSSSLLRRFVCRSCFWCVFDVDICNYATSFLLSLAIRCSPRIFQSAKIPVVGETISIYLIFLLCVCALYSSCFKKCHCHSAHYKYIHYLWQHVLSHFEIVYSNLCHIPLIIIIIIITKWILRIN